MFLNTIKSDIQTIFEKDPAAKSKLEVLICYPGLHSILIHRLSHYLYTKKMPVIPRGTKVKRSHSWGFLAAMQVQ